MPAAGGRGVQPQGEQFSATSFHRGPRARRWLSGLSLRLFDTLLGGHTALERPGCYPRAVLASRPLVSVRTQLSKGAVFSLRVAIC